ncbi:MAG TPA: metallophosphoesterase, partial [Polyangiales bacterium]|nr:metallophosphoesterase [Polyangiales bacterium]
MLKILHTADWHLGRRFPRFSDEDQRKLMHARLAVVERVLGEAQKNSVHAVLCAGDLFDEP